MVVADTCVQELESQLPYPISWNNTPRGCLGESASPWRVLGIQGAARAVCARACAMQPCAGACAAGVLIGRAWTLARVQLEPSNTLRQLGSTVSGVCDIGQAQQFPTGRYSMHMPPQTPMQQQETYKLREVCVPAPLRVHM